jgi:hypothetical protein
LFYYHQISEQDFKDSSNGITNGNISKGSNKKGFYNQYSFAFIDVSIQNNTSILINKKISFMVFKNGKTKITGANSMQELQVCKKFMSE